MREDLHSLTLVATNVNSANPSGSYERERVEKRHLPRLAPEFYRSTAFVHWTLTIENRTTGWLTSSFHHAWQLMLLHTCARYELVCPAYVLMSDHLHLLWLGLNQHASDQRIGIEFLRKHLKSSLAPADWQHQTHDHVLCESERERGAFAIVAQYLLDNPVRAGLAERWQEYPFIGCCVAGYPNLDPTLENYWDLFWRIYNRLIDPTSSTRSRS